MVLGALAEGLEGAVPEVRAALRSKTPQKIWPVLLGLDLKGVAAMVLGVWAEVLEGALPKFKAVLEAEPSKFSQCSWALLSKGLGQWSCVLELRGWREQCPNSKPLVKAKPS